MRRIRSAWIAVLWSTVCGVPSIMEAYTSADADLILAAHSKAFFREEGDRGWHTKTTDGGKAADYWTRAEMLEMVLDAHARTRDPAQLEMFGKLFRGFLADHGRTWERNTMSFERQL